MLSIVENYNLGLIYPKSRPQNWVVILSVFWSSLFFSQFALAKKSPTVELASSLKKAQERVYSSKDDSAIRIKTVYLEKFTDNLNNIYSEKSKDKIKSIIENDHQWELVDDPSVADVVVSSRITKNPNNLTVKLVFSFEKADSLSIIESVDLQNVFETEKILQTYEALLNNIKKKIPYQGIILSRTHDQVTLNIGKIHGLVENQDVWAILIAKITRHPKTKQFISAEREVLGKIRLSKVDDYLSFGKILYERDDNAIQRETKLDFSSIDVRLANENLEIKNRTDSPVVIGDSPHEWIPNEKPQYGKVSLTGGLIQYSQNLNFVNTGAKTVGQWLTPTIKASIEAWINSVVHIELYLRQSSFKLTNPLSASEPGSLNTSLSQYHVKAKYNFELDSKFRSPQFQAILGLGQFQSSVDTSTPLSLSTQSFGGILLGFNGQFPISEEIPIDLGLYINYFLTKTLSDSSSASPSGMEINDFGVLVKYIKSQRLSYVFELSFESYASDFDALTGTRADPVNNVSHQLLTTLAGIEYSF